MPLLESALFKYAIKPIVGGILGVSYPVVSQSNQPLAFFLATMSIILAIWFMLDITILIIRATA